MRFQVGCLGDLDAMMHQTAYLRVEWDLRCFVCVRVQCHRQVLTATEFSREGRGCCIELLFLTVTILSDFYWYYFCFFAMWASKDSSCEIRLDDSLDYRLESRSKELLISSALLLMLSVMVLANSQLLLAVSYQCSVLYLLIWPLCRLVLRMRPYCCAFSRFCLIFLTRYQCTECQQLTSSTLSFFIFLRILSSALHIQRPLSFCLMAEFLKSLCFISLASYSSSASRKLTSCACILTIVRFSFARVFFSTFALFLQARSKSLPIYCQTESDVDGGWLRSSPLAFQQNLSIYSNLKGT